MAAFGPSLNGYAAGTGTNSGTITFTNTSVIYPSPTGVSFHIAPFVLMMVAGLGLMPARMPRRRRRREES